MTEDNADRVTARLIVANWQVNFSPDEDTALENMIESNLIAQRNFLLNRFLSLAGEFEGTWDESDGDTEHSGWVTGQREAGTRLRELIEELK